jgi:phosphoribosyl 1,2-cyclic phosphodiesterase
VRISVLGSGSSGNCLVVEADGERLVLDAGMGPNRAATCMRALGSELVTQRAPLGVIVTHDHGDHAAHAVPLSRALRAPLFAHDSALLERARSRVPVRSYLPGRPLALGPFVVEALPVPHDAPHVALRVSAGGYRFAIATDVGHVRHGLRAFLADCDLVFLESNYCPQLLEIGPYPPKLKRRVGGPLGHLANQQTAELAAGLEDTRVARLVLVHLSRANNTRERALDTVRSRVRRLPVEALDHGGSGRFALEGRRRRAEQLAFAFT